MPIFTSSLSSNSDALALFVNEKCQYKDKRGVLSKALVLKIDSFLNTIKNKKKNDEIISFDLSSKQKFFIIKVKNNYESFYPEEIGGKFFSHLKKSQDLNTIDLYES